MAFQGVVAEDFWPFGAPPTHPRKPKKLRAPRNNLDKADVHHFVTITLHDLPFV